jgi:hypothetical protein
LCGLHGGVWIGEKLGRAGWFGMSRPTPETGKEKEES